MYTYKWIYSLHIWIFDLKQGAIGTETTRLHSQDAKHARLMSQNLCKFATSFLVAP